MSKIDTELFIARKISPQGGKGQGVMVRIATISVAIGMAVMILSMCVIDGFRHEITAKLTSFGGDVQATAMTSNGTVEGDPVTVNIEFEERAHDIKGFESLWRYTLKSGIIRTADAIEGVVLKGVDGSFDFSPFASALIEGELPDVSAPERKKEIMISEHTAKRLKITVGDRIEMMFIGGERPMRRDRFKVSGIYATGMESMDEVMTFTDIRSVTRLNGWSEEQITGYEINTSDFNNLEAFTYDIYRLSMEVAPELDETMRVNSIVELYPNIFDWLRAHNVNAAVIITIMLIVALMNMISAMLIIMLERTSMIGVLKALGMTNRAVQKIFLLRSLRIVLRGMLYGNIAGITLAMIQKYTHLMKLDSAGYMLSEVPIRFGAEWLIGLNIGVPLLITLLLTIPVAVVSLIKPEQTIRYQ